MKRVKTMSDHYKTYKIGRLYFVYIRNTCLMRDGWTADRLYKYLLERGFIVPSGKGWTYAEGGTISRRELLKMIYKQAA